MMKRKCILHMLAMAFLVSGTLFAVACALPNACAEPDESKSAYRLNESGTEYILASVGKEVTAVDIPAEINGIPVTTIGENAFEHIYGHGCGATYSGAQLTRLTIPVSVTTIERYAFPHSDRGSKIDELYYGGTVADWCKMTIECSPFDANTKFYADGRQVTALNLDESTPYIPDNAFAYLQTVQSVTFAGGVKSIGENAFAYGAIPSADLADSVTAIGRGAFAHCISLTEAHLGAGADAIPEECFLDCQNLRTVRFDTPLKSLGEYAFMGCSALNDIDLRDCTFTTIPYAAFYGCGELTSIVIPERVTDIGDRAFEGCLKLIQVYNLSNLPLEPRSQQYGGVAQNALVILTDPDENRIYQIDGLLFFDADVVQLLAYRGDEPHLTLPEEVNGKPYTIWQSAFANNATLVSVHLPATVEHVGSYAFYQCKNLKSARIDGAAEIGEEAFYNCTSLDSVQCERAVAIGDGAFRYSSIRQITLGEGLKQIGDKAFYQCTQLADIDLPQSLTNIGNYAFSSCPLTQVTLPEDIDTVRIGTFSNCQQLKEVVIQGARFIQSNAFYGAPIERILFPDRLEEKGYDAFAGNRIKELNLPAKLDDFGNNFADKSNLERIAIAEDNPLYYSVGDCLIERQIGALLMGCKNSVIPDDGSVTAIGKRAFYNAPVTEMKLPSSVTSIYGYAFANCSNLTDIALPQRLTEIGEYAFEKSGLTDIVLPQGIKALSAGVFNSCVNLTNVTLPVALEEIGEKAFCMDTALKEITIPASVTYIGWSAFAGAGLVKATFESDGAWTVTIREYGEPEITVKPSTPQKNAYWLTDKYCHATWTNVPLDQYLNYVIT